MSAVRSPKPGRSARMWRLFRQGGVLLWMYLVVYHPGATLAYAIGVIVDPTNALSATTRWIGSTYPYARCPIRLTVAPLLNPESKSRAWVEEVAQACGAHLVPTRYDPPDAPP